MKVKLDFLGCFVSALLRILCLEAFPVLEGTLAPYRHAGTGPMLKCQFWQDNFSQASSGLGAKVIL